MWLLTLLCTLTASRSRAVVSPSGSAWSPGGPAISWMAGAGLSGVRLVSMGAARETVRPCLISPAAASTRSGVRWFSAPRRSAPPQAGTWRSRR